MWEKLSTYTLDVSKYILTGVVIASMFNGITDQAFVVVGGGFISALLLVLGLYFTRHDDCKKKKSNTLSNRKNKIRK